MNFQTASWVTLLFTMDYWILTNTECNKFNKTAVTYICKLCLIRVFYFDSKIHTLFFAIYSPWKEYITFTQSDKGILFLQS